MKSVFANYGTAIVCSVAILGIFCLLFQGIKGSGDGKDSLNAALGRIATEKINSGGTYKDTELFQAGTGSKVAKLQASEKLLCVKTDIRPDDCIDLFDINGKQLEKSEVLILKIADQSGTEQINIFSQQSGFLYFQKAGVYDVDVKASYQNDGGNLVSVKGRVSLVIDNA